MKTVYKICGRYMHFTKDWEMMDGIIPDHPLSKEVYPTRFDY